MKRAITIYLSFVIALCVGCTSNAPKEIHNATTHPETGEVYTLIALIFTDTHDKVEGNIQLGPFRLIGADESITLTSIAAPYCSYLTGQATLNRSTTIDTSIAMYSDRQGFSKEYPPCWRIFATTTQVELENIELEINYAYSYNSTGGSTYIEGMQRIPLQESIITTGEEFPFTIYCIRLPMPQKKQIYI
jgi:hypothetical protein